MDKNNRLTDKEKEFLVAGIRSWTLQSGNDISPAVIRMMVDGADVFLPYLKLEGFAEGNLVEGLMKDFNRESNKLSIIESTARKAKEHSRLMFMTALFGDFIMKTMDRNNTDFKSVTDEEISTIADFTLRASDILFKKADEKMEAEDREKESVFLTSFEKLLEKYEKKEE